MSKQSIQFTDSNGNISLPESAESGSNANGNYTKFADGTLICYGKVEFVTASVGVQSVTKSFPMSFISSPYVTISAQDTEFTSSYMSMFWCKADANSITAYAKRINANVNWYASYIAIGRWK